VSHSVQEELPGGPSELANVLETDSVAEAHSSCNKKASMKNFRLWPWSVFLALAHACMK
jgi:hypothetical protein